MSTNPIWIAGYGGTPTGGASPVWIVGYGGAIAGAAESWIAGYGGTPTGGASPVWVMGYGGTPTGGASPIWIGGVIESGGGPSYSAQTIAYLARTVGGNEGGNAANIATLIDGLVADGVWSNLDALYVLAQQNQTDALLNLVGTTYSLSNAGLLRTSVFTSYQGFKAVGVSYLNTLFNPTTAPSPHFTQNSASIGGWSYSVSPGNTNALISYSSAGSVWMADNYPSNTFYARVNDAAGGGVATTITKGLFTGDRTDASHVYPYQNGVSAGPVSSTSSALASDNIIIGNSNTAETVSAAFIGGSLGSAGQLALYNRLRTYMTAVGVP